MSKNNTFLCISFYHKGEDFLKVPQNFKNHGHGIQNTASAIAIALSTDQLVFIPKIAAINELKQNKQAVIIDYGNSGRALLTLKYIFETINRKYN